MHPTRPVIGLLLWLGVCAAGCRGVAPAPTPPPAPGAAAPTQAMVTLSIQATPAGATVRIDGEPRGTSPLILSLPEGQHEILLQAEGYAPLRETLDLAGGSEATYTPSLADIAPPAVTLRAEPGEVPWSGRATVRASATDNAGVAELGLWAGEQQLAAAEGGLLEYDLAPADEPDIRPGDAVTLTARASDAAGNVGEATLILAIGPLSTPTPPRSQAAATPAPTRTPVAPAATPSPTAPTATPSGPAAGRATPAGVTAYRVGEISISTYPYAPYVSTVPDPNMGDYPVQVLDRAAYEAANPQPVPQRYRLLTLENRYLRLDILPELGGRVYQVIFKPTGNNELYRNPVIKPTAWGPPAPAGANWWVAAGGIEWGFPVSEHGYEWGTPWGYDHVPTEDGGVMVSLFTRDPRRPYAVVDIILPPDTAAFVVRPRITNPWGSDFRFQWWTNAMAAPGPANKPGPDLRFVFPPGQMTVHSTGDPALPGPGEPLSWPVHNGRDLSRLGNWTGWLGFFARPAARGDFAGVYDEAADEGLVRVYPSGTARGAKGFAMGWTAPIDWHAWTDDGSGYVELQGGLAPTFDDWYTLPPGGEITWDEIWYPVAGIGGLTHAEAGGAIHLAPTGSALRVGVFPTRAVQGTLTIALPGAAPIVRQVSLGPGAPFAEEIAYGSEVPASGAVGVTLQDGRGRTVLAYTEEVRFR